MSVTENKIKQMMANKKVLIVEPSTAFASIIVQTLVANGCKSENILKEPDFRKALNFIEKNGPDIVVSEYQLNGGYGLELSEKQVAYFPNPTQRIFILVTSNSDTTAVAEAAEEEVDAYLLKPFTPKQLHDTIAKVIDKKLNPSEYALAIQSGKESLVKGDFAGALEIFNKAKDLDPKPSLAYYYIGFCQTKLKNTDMALESYRSGRKFVNLHYKCLQGEFDILFEKKMHEDAYEVIKIIGENYPISPGTLAKMFLLAIYTYNYKDIEKYYDLFKALDRRNNELIRIVSAALYSAGRFCMNGKDTANAIEFFKKGVSVAQRDTGYISKVVRILLEAQQIDEAEKFLMMFPMDKRDSAEFLQLDFEIVHKTREPLEVLERGKRAIDDGKASPEIYREVVKILIHQNKKTAAEHIIFKSSKTHPDLKAELYSILENKKSG